MASTLKVDTIVHPTGTPDNLTLDNAGNVTVGNNLTVTGTTTQTGSTTFTTQTLFPDGTAGAPAISNTGDTNTGIFFPAADTIGFSDGGVESMRIDASGNLGLGVTPSAWSIYTGVLEFPGGSNIEGFSTGFLGMGSNHYFNGSNFIYKISSYASRFSMDNTGGFKWYTAPSGTAGNAITFTQAMTVDQYGSLLVGTTTSPTTTSALGTISTPGTLVMGSSFKRNRIINGNMVVDQRNSGASVTPTVDNTYSADRFSARLTQASKYSIQQVTDAPTGFVNSIKVTSLSSYAVTSTDFFGVVQYIEGLNSSDLNWGTASSKTVTLSFWVKSTLSGTFGATIFAYQLGYPSYPFSYTIIAPNVWEYKTVTISGPTSGSFVTTSAGNIAVEWSTGTGSSLLGTANTWDYSTLYRSVPGETSIVGTNGATWQITGVQLEVGSVATPYERQIYSDQLQQCYRYCQTLKQGVGCWTTGSLCQINIPYLQVMRAAPTVSQTATITVTDYIAVDLTQSSTSISIVNGNDQYGTSVFIGNFTGATGGRVAGIRNYGGTGVILLSSEL